MTHEVFLNEIEQNQGSALIKTPLKMLLILGLRDWSGGRTENTKY